MFKIIMKPVLGFKFVIFIFCFEIDRTELWAFNVLKCV